MITVRPAAPADWQAVRSVRLAALLDSPEAFGGSYADSAARSEEEWQAWPRNGQAFLAFDGDEPLGMVASWDSPDTPGVTTLISMWVTPQARGRGVADALVDALVSSTTQTVELNVYDSNPRARAFYLKYGFTDAQRTHEGQPGVTMRLILSPPA
jgi:ribosomal protein S18 acetylase RimI-like enzyme